MTMYLDSTAAIGTEEEMLRIHGMPVIADLIRTLTIFQLSDKEAKEVKDMNWSARMSLYRQKEEKAKVEKEKEKEKIQKKA